MPPTNAVVYSLGAVMLFHSRKERGDPEPEFEGDSGGRYSICVNLGAQDGFYWIKRDDGESQPAGAGAGRRAASRCWLSRTATRAFLQRRREWLGRGRRRVSLCCTAHTIPPGVRRGELCAGAGRPPFSCTSRILLIRTCAPRFARRLT